MRSVGGKPTQPLKGVAQTRECLVENGREAPEFVARVVYWQPLVERFHGDQPRLVRHGTDRREHAAGEKVASGYREADGERDAHREDDCECPEGVPDGGLIDRRGNGISKRGDLLHAVVAAVGRGPGYRGQVVVLRRTRKPFPFPPFRTMADVTSLGDLK